MRKSDIFWQSYLSLEKEIIEVSKYIFIADSISTHKGGKEITESCTTQLDTFSPYIADLLVRSCVQIEAISKELYYDNGGEKPRGDSSIFFDEDCLKLIDKKWATHNKRVIVVSPLFNLTKDENKVICPLKEAHKKGGTRWERAYQAVKHDRVGSLKEGTVRHLLHALAALYLLNLYYRKDSWMLKYTEITTYDYSMGSSIFAVNPPITGQLWYGNNPQQSESPFVVTYDEDVYKRIVEIQKSESEALVKYWEQQPELKDPEFATLIGEKLKKKEADPSEQVMPIWELGKYRLQKLLPSSLSFEARKEALLKSEAWNCRVNQSNKHRLPDEITSDNIDNEIEISGIRWGMEIQMKYNRMAWANLAFNEGLCKVYIPT